MAQLVFFDVAKLGGHDQLDKRLDHVVLGGGFDCRAHRRGVELKVIDDAAVGEAIDEYRAVRAAQDLGAGARRIRRPRSDRPAWRR